MQWRRRHGRQRRVSIITEEMVTLININGNEEQKKIIFIFDLSGLFIHSVTDRININRRKKYNIQLQHSLNKLWQISILILNNLMFKEARDRKSKFPTKIKFS